MPEVQTGRDQKARHYATRHLRSGPGVQSIYYLRQAPDGEIRFVEVDTLSLQQDKDPFEPFDYGVDFNGESPYKLLILDVTPAQWTRVRKGKIPLPPGWTFEGAVRFFRKSRDRERSSVRRDHPPKQREIVTPEVQTSRDQMARHYAGRHLRTGPGVRSIYYLRQAPDHEIRFLEVDELSLQQDDEPFEPLDFGLDVNGEAPFKLLNLDVTPAQWKGIRRGEIPLPPGWTLEGATRFFRKK